MPCYYSIILYKFSYISQEAAKKTMENPLFFGAMLVAQEQADCYVSGCANPTSNVLRALVQIVKPEPGIKTISSAILQFSHATDLGEQGIVLFADPAVVPDPSPEQLADIAIAAAHTWQRLMKKKAHVAMLSFSTKNSAKHPMVDKIRAATTLAKQKAPDISIDGELQSDAALVPEVAAFKAKGSAVAGHANVLIFPDLNTGNIAYKLLERLGKTVAIGPLLQGLSKPCSDLSRGCKAQDIVNVSTLILAEALDYKK